MTKRAGLQHAVPALAVFGGIVMAIMIDSRHFMITIVNTGGIGLW